MVGKFIVLRVFILVWVVIGERFGLGVLGLGVCLVIGCGRKVIVR